MYAIHKNLCVSFIHQRHLEVKTQMKWNTNISLDSDAPALQWDVCDEEWFSDWTPECSSHDQQSHCIHIQSVHHNRTFLVFFIYLHLIIMISENSHYIKTSQYTAPTLPRHLFKGIIHPKTRRDLCHLRLMWYDRRSGQRYSGQKRSTHALILRWFFSCTGSGEMVKLPCGQCVRG